MLGTGGGAMDRRIFMGKAATLVVGLLAMVKGGSTRAEGFSGKQEVSGRQGTRADVALPPFEKTKDFALEKALVERRSTKSYDPDRKLSLEEISRLLWAASGVNRPGGGRTVPSARGRYPVDVLAALPDGVYLYEPKRHTFKRLITEDIRPVIPLQDGFRKAAMIVLYVINKEKASNVAYADLEIGCMGQNLYLEASALGLGSCIFAGISYDRVTKALGLKDNQALRMAQSVGAAK
jgi:SagB-type dehydrogenase family enzyme